VHCDAHSIEINGEPKDAGDPFSWIPKLDMIELARKNGYAWACCKKDGNAYSWLQVKVSPMDEERAGIRRRIQ